MMNTGNESVSKARQEILVSLRKHGVAILPPMDVTHSLRLMDLSCFQVAVTMLDPWYNKGVGGVRDDYNNHVTEILDLAAPLSDHVFLWGFPEIVARFVDKIPERLSLVAWLTWFYKNSPSVIRGWRSSQMACLHMAAPEARLFPENFLNEAQTKLKNEGKLRYMPGPTSVIEDSLLVGFVGKKEQTGHPAQKPASVFKKLLLMATEEGDVVLDPMSGSGTTGVAAREIGRASILADHSEEYTQIAEQRLGLERITIDKDLEALLSIEANGESEDADRQSMRLSFIPVLASGDLREDRDGGKSENPQNSLFPLSSED